MRLLPTVTHIPRTHPLQQIATWVVPRVGFSYFIKSEQKQINKLIEKAIVDADEVQSHPPPPPPKKKGGGGGGGRRPQKGRLWKKGGR